MASPFACSHGIEPGGAREARSRVDLRQPLTGIRECERRRDIPRPLTEVPAETAEDGRLRRKTDVSEGRWNQRQDDSGRRDGIPGV